MGPVLLRELPFVTRTTAENHLGTFLNEASDDALADSSGTAVTKQLDFLVSVDEAAKTVTYHIESCSFPNWSGIERKSTFKITGDELTFTNPMSSIGAVPDQVVWKRAK